MRSGDKDYRDYYLSMALMHTTALIREMDRRPTSVVFYCVSLLMWISVSFCLSGNTTIADNWSLLRATRATKAPSRHISTA